MAALTIVLFLGGFQAVPVARPDPALIRVYVHTDPDGHKDEVAARVVSRKDLATALGDKKKLVAVVDDEDLADVSVEVAGRGVEVPRVVIGLAGRPGEPPPGLVRVGTLEVVVKSGPAAVTMKNKNRTNDNPRGWKSAAEDIADQLEKWIRDHREEIIRRRSGLP